MHSAGLRLRVVDIRCAHAAPFTFRRRAGAMTCRAAMLPRFAPRASSALPESVDVLRHAFIGARHAARYERVSAQRARLCRHVYAACRRRVVTRHTP